MAEQTAAEKMNGTGSAQCAIQDAPQVTVPLSRSYQCPFDQPWRIAVTSLFCRVSFGSRAIFAFMKDCGYDVDLVLLKEKTLNEFDMPSEAELALYIDLLRERKVRAVGLAVRSMYLKFAADLTARIHDELSVPVVWGGTAATVTPALCITKGADYAVCGEGEETFAELMAALGTGMDPSAIQGLWYATPDGPKGNPVRPLIGDLDGLPLPVFSGENVFCVDSGRVDADDPIQEYVSYDIMTSRGCPFRCTYCTNSALREIYGDNPGPFVRQHSVEYVLREFEAAMERRPHLKTAYFSDEVFGARLPWLQEFVPQYLKRVGLPFRCMIDPRLITEEKLALIKEMGVTEVEVGIQGGSEETRINLFERRVTDEELLEAARLLSKYNIPTKYGLISDIPVETRKHKIETLDLLLKLPQPWFVILYSLNNYPGTTLTKRSLDQGVITEDDVIGESDKGLVQFGVSFDFPRPPEDHCWHALYSLASKPFIPKRLVRWLSRREWFMRHPKPVIMLARAATLVRVAITGTGMLIRGDISLAVAFRWARGIRSISH
jgi:radical SAM superfamily enzyme YgiQ (UPF0313 family)